MKKLELFLPLKTSTIFQGFGQCFPDVCEQYKKWGLLGHNGLDLYAAHAEPVYSSHDGKATHAGGGFN